jgi:hypothetical protein
VFVVIVPDNGEFGSRSPLNSHGTEMAPQNRSAKRNEGKRRAASSEVEQPTAFELIQPETMLKALFAP